MSIIGFAGEISFEDKVVAHFKDGRIVKGHTRDFSPGRDSFTLQPYSGETGPVPIFLEELKAVFHVKTFEGDANHPPPTRKVGTISESRFSEVMKRGKPVSLEFADGEHIWGYAKEYSEDKPGFFFFPTDPHDNNVRLYVLRSSLKNVTFLDH